VSHVFSRSQMVRYLFIGFVITTKTQDPSPTTSTPTHEACAGNPGSAAEEYASLTGIRDRLVIE
jgi:hypothetical protein